VLLAIDDLESAILGPTADVPGMQPAVVVENFGRLLWRLVVALEDGGALDAYLASLKR
jgi:hypothetical protein